jgi:TATA-binding protein-associated factor Taf7
MDDSMFDEAEYDEMYGEREYDRDEGEEDNEGNDDGEGEEDEEDDGEDRTARNILKYKDNLPKLYNLYAEALGKISNDNVTCSFNYPAT